MQTSEENTEDVSRNPGSVDSVGTDMCVTLDGHLDTKFDVDNSYETPMNDQDECAWWLSSPIPNFTREVWPLLKKFIPYENGAYVVERDGKKMQRL